MKPWMVVSAMVLPASGCIDITKLGDFEDTDGAPMGDQQGTPDEGEPIRDVDILFVLDNSGSMAEEQASLAAAISVMTDTLVEAQVSFRIAVTTTDVGFPQGGCSTPESGAFVMSSCRSRLQDFSFFGMTEVDAQRVGCLDVCDLETLDLVPTTIDGVTSQRPWIEWSPAGSNVADGAIEPALSCALPQGINGCGYEAPLEAMREALLGSSTPGHPNFRFLRPNAHLAIVLVTDEEDCSRNPAWDEEFFAQEGSLWTSENFTSSICWQAGTACSGGPEVFDECHSENHDIDGNPGVADHDAVLFPLSRYLEALDWAAVYKPRAEVGLFALVGRPTNNGEFVYANGDDPLLVETYGIGPGCESASGLAFPPVRVREVAQTFNGNGDGNLYSICNADYLAPTAAITSSMMHWVDGR